MLVIGLSIIRGKLFLAFLCIRYPHMDDMDITDLLLCEGVYILLRESVKRTEFNNEMFNISTAQILGSTKQKPKFRSSA